MNKKVMSASLLASILTLGISVTASSEPIIFTPNSFITFNLTETSLTSTWLITGKVTTLSGEGIPGVTVTIKGSTIGTTTDVDGKYSVNAPESAGSLVFSSIGYASKEIRFSSPSTINVDLSEDILALNEVVVTGYSKEEKKDIVGSVAIVSPKDLTATPTGNVTSQLQGRSPGVAVASDGGLGGSAKVRIRGFGSFGDSSPLYVIDGVPVTTNGVSTTSPVDNINPNDIESLQVLKDAAAAAIYGARAANGVVIITTKQGKSGSAKFSVDSYYGSNYFSKNNFPDLLNAKEFGEMYWKQLAGAYQTSNGNQQYLAGSPTFVGHPQYGKGITPVIPEYIYVNNNGTKFGGTDLEALKTGNPSLFQSLVDPANYNFKTHQIVKSGDTDWFRETFRAAPVQSHQLGVSGGSPVGNYALSLSLFDQKSTVAKTSGFTRYTLRSNSSFNIKKHIRVGENIQVTYSSIKGNEKPIGSGAVAAWVMSPIIPLYDIMGNPASSAAPGLVATNAAGRNPITESYRQRFNTNQNYAIFGNAYLEADIAKGLTARTSFGLDYTNRNQMAFAPVTYEHAENTSVNIQTLTKTNNNSTTWTWTNTLNYNLSLHNRHSLKFLLGSEAIKTYVEGLTAARQSANGITPAYAVEDNPDFLVLNAGVGIQTNSGFFARNSLYSVFARVDYSYADKYLFNATIRRDQSSKFASATRTGYFPAVALGWRVSSEAFMKDVTWVNDLKLRASFGAIGNQTGLSNENQYSVYVSDLNQSYPITGSNSLISNSYAPRSLGNSKAKWEQSLTTNLGIDATLFNNSLDVSLEVYDKRTTGLLVVNQPAYTSPTGTNTNINAPLQPSINAGSMTNRGIDLGLTKRGNIVEGLKYEIGVTFSKYKNNVTKVLDNPLAFISSTFLNTDGTAEATRFSNVPNRTQVGSPIGVFYGYQLDGFFNNQEEVNAFNSKYNPSGSTTPWIPPAVGRWKIKDVNQDGVINDKDRTVIGSPHPDFQMSMNLSLAYKGFDFTGFLFWNQGGSIFNYSRYNTDFNTFQYNRSSRMSNDSWTPENTNAKLPKLDLLDTYSNQNVSSYFVENASFLRLKTIQLGYTLPKGLLVKYGIDRMRIYIQSQNIFTTKHKSNSSLDPGMGLSGNNDTALGIVYSATPTPKQVLVGLSFGF